MRKRHYWRYSRVFLTVVIMMIVALAGSGLAADTGSLPARQWNQENLSRIKELATEPLNFVVLGDNRDNPEVFGEVLRQAASDPGLSFAVHLGDMVKVAAPGLYGIFFNVVRQNYPKPLVTVIGNHELYGEGGWERGLELYREIFGPDYFSFQLGSNYFIVIDDAAKEVMTPEQFGWLERELQKSQAAKTRLVFLHIPLFDPSGSPKPHSLPPEAAARLLALFKKYQVSHIFAAHLHGYYAGAWDGLPFTITGGAGAPMYGKDTRHDFYHYVKVTVAGDKVKVQVRPLAGREGK